MRAVVGSSAAKFVEVERGSGSCCLLSWRVTMPGSRSDSSWKCTRAAIRSLEKSFAPRLPSRMGAVKRRQRDVHASRKAGKVRTADLVRAS